VKDGPPLAMTSGAQIPVNVREAFTETNWSGSASYSENGRSYSINSGPRVYLQIELEPLGDFAQRQSYSLRMPRSSADHSLAIEGVPPGSYWVRPHTARGYIASITSGTTDLSRAPLVVSGGGAPIDVVVRDDTATLEGTVTGLNTSSSNALTPETIGQASSNVGPSGLGEPAAFIYCVPLPDSPGQYREFWASPDGQFNMPEMAPGTYRILVFDRRQPSLPYRDAEAMRAYESQGQVVHLSPGQSQQVQVQLISGGEEK